MLVLSRKRSETVQILNETTGEELFVTVTELRGDKVRLGFTGPANYRFMRTEVLPLIAAEGERGPADQPAMPSTQEDTP